MPASLAETRAAARRELLAAGFAADDVDASLAVTRAAMFFALAPEAPEETIPLGASKIGGNPDLADGTSWPNGATAFLLQINLADVPEGVLDIALTREGLLSCFLNKGSQVTLIWNKPGSNLTRHVQTPSAKRFEARLLAATILLTLNIDDRNLPAVEDEEIFDVIEDWSVPENGVQLGGNRKVIARGEAPDMYLILQIGSLDEIGMIWGTLGCLTVSMRPEDIAARAFERVVSAIQSF